MDRAEKINNAIEANQLPTLRGRHVGLPCQLARLSGMAQSTIRYACAHGNVRTYLPTGDVLLVDAGDLVEYIRTTRPGRKRVAKVERD